MRRTAVIALFAAAAAWASPVSDLRDGQNISFDLLGATYTYSGFQSGAGVIADEDAPPTCVVKAQGSLDITIDLADLGAPFSAVVTFTGTEVNANTVRWTADTLINQCVTVVVDGQSLQLLIRRVWGQLTGAAANEPGFVDEACNRFYNVRVQETGGDAQTWVNVETYALCQQLSFLRIDFQLRSWDFDIAGGVNCPGDANGDNQIDFADLNIVLGSFNQTGQGLQGDLNGDGVVNFADLNLVLGNFNLTC
ncbi:MAG: hypothetical protein IBJ10_06250 [Phycisphaerales bacterium]|nr:hypothetical protein [Phycisphaerales bacterium]